MYRYTFYNIPYSKNGIERLIPADPYRTAIDQYYLTEIISNESFSETQASFILKNSISVGAGDASAWGRANYVRIAHTQAGATVHGNYNLDDNPAYYWIDDMQVCAAPDGANRPERIYISPDAWATDLLDNIRDAMISGDVVQTTDESMQESAEIYELPVAPKLYDVGGIQTINADRSPSSWKNYYRVLFTGTDGLTDDIKLFAIDAWKSGTGDLTGSTGDTIYHSVIDVSKIAKIRIKGSGTESNFTVLNIYVLPVFLINGRLSTAGETYECVNNSGVGDFTRVYFDNPITPPALNNYFQLAIPTEFRIPGARVFLQTPKQFIEIENNRAGNFITHNITFFAMASTTSSDALSLYFNVNGKIYDVTDDFLADFVIAEDQLKISQNKTSYAISQIGSLIGAAGGTLGGLISGNWFGAIQSFVGGISGLTDPIRAFNEPGALRGSGSVMNMACSCQTCVQFVMIPPASGGGFENYITRYGLILPNEPHIHGRIADLTREGGGENFWRMKNVSVYNISGGQNSAQEIADIFTRGVILKYE